MQNNLTPDFLFSLIPDQTNTMYNLRNSDHTAGIYARTSLYLYVYSKNLKNLFLKNRNSWSLDIKHETSSSECLQSLFNQSPKVRICLAPGDH
jgi:hypothetical protein